MSLLIKVRGADFSKLGLPVLEQTIFGFPAENLKGLYLLEDGTQDTVFNGPFIDSSGNGNHAKVRDTWTAPLKRKSGIATNSEHGMVIETPIPSNTSFTWIFVGRHTLPIEQQPGKYPSFVGQTDALASDMTGSSPNTNGLLINSDLDKTPSNTSFDAFGAYSGKGTMSRRHIVGSKSSIVTVIGMTFNVETGEMHIRDLNGRSASATDSVVAAAIRAFIGNVTFGCWKHGAFTPMSGEAHLFAHYDQVLGDAGLLKAMQAAKSRVESRGISVV
ncbi:MULTISPECIES: hypothetical protein [Vibrio harveyi group]|jgi:hypothetical protein|uniref:hypothetical protein n=1 Tax=Vibrio harveyi group TaxID=717610 RepID=UPI00084B35AA|nr:hypothetical protein [Vibrio parahaemolyticus]EHH2499165.1 hypothetical protein [Vibrio parahaemolyticus]ODZ20086.1 hypothetical protein BBM36_16710 [Vibrio parahaemolyticus]TOB63118.1 hypothetical protein CGK01_21495 [Vibrio parahaemolyticus]HCG7354070.1 hypothetical protein [Vibrio parahaemolyticus]